jgi:hypothetical protein
MPKLEAVGAMCEQRAEASAAGRRTSQLCFNQNSFLFRSPAFTWRFETRWTGVGSRGLCIYTAYFILAAAGVISPPWPRATEERVGQREYGFDSR